MNIYAKSTQAWALAARLVCVGAFSVSAVGVAALAGCDKHPADDAEAGYAAKSSGDHGADDESSAAHQSTTNQASSGSTASHGRADRWKADDTHTHLSPYAYPLAIDAMDEARIYRVVNMSGGHAADFRRANLRAADQYPGRIALFFNVDWDNVDDPDFGRQMARGLAQAVSEGYAGLKITKQLGLGVKTADGQLLAVDDPRLDPLWTAAGHLGVPVGIHTGDPKAFFEKPDADNERWAELKLAPSWSFYGDEYPSRDALLAARDRVISRHPDTTFILLHIANNPEDLDYVDHLMDTHDNVLIDVAARLAEVGRHDARRVRKFFEKHQDRILFATDMGLRARPAPKGLRYRLTLGSVRKTPPKLDDIPGFYRRHWRYFESDAPAVDHPIPIQGDWKIHPVDLPDGVLDKIYWKNAERRVFTPWLGRRAATAVAAQTRRVVGIATTDHPGQ